MKTFIVLAVLLVTVVCAVQAKNVKNATLVLLDDAVASSQGAMCLDGSPTGYYMREGSGDGTNKWILHLGGGGWCNSTAICYNRSFTWLGSSKKWPQSTGLDGFLSDNPTVNPHFKDWNIVYVMYCDGGSFAGFVANPDVYKNKNIYYRGRVNLKVSLDDLMKRGMDKATDVVLTGCSAGGLATYLHADAVRSYLPQAIKFKAFPDAGYFLDTPNIHEVDQFRNDTQNLFKMQNLSAGVNQDCIKNQKPEDMWMCLFAPYTYKFVKTPLFVLNSMYDKAQLTGLYQLPCLPPMCPPKYLEAFYDYGQTFLFQAKPLMASDPSKNGYFIDSCIIHCQSLFDLPWSTFSINGQSISNTFARWYSGDGAVVSNTRLTDCESPYGCNPTCPGVYNETKMAELRLPMGTYSP